MSARVEIDGARGEGGGQILRTSLALAVITGRPVRIRNVRARRSKPGLQAQHLASVQAAARICDGGVAGDKLGSTEVELVPRGVAGGELVWSIGTAGSAGLVLQTVLVPLFGAARPSRIVIDGGTHNKLAPPYDFLARAYVPLLRRMGARVTIALERHGFYPAGGGRIVCTVEPGRLGAIALEDPGPVRARRARAVIAQIPRHVAERELAVVRQELGFGAGEVAIEEVASRGPGNALVVEIEREHVTEVATGIAERGVPAERVARTAAEELGRWLRAGVPVGEHLADQLMLPMAVAGAGRYRTLPLTLHSTTNLDTIRAFLDVPIDVSAAPGGVTVTFG